MMGPMKRQLIGYVPQIGLGALVNFFFDGFARQFLEVLCIECTGRHKGPEDLFLDQFVGYQD